MKKTIAIIMLIVILAMPMSSFAAGETWEVPVNMMHQSMDPNKFSMGNNAINHIAIVREANGKYEFNMQFKSMELMNLNGEITNLFVYSNHDAKVKAEVSGKAIDVNGYSKEFSFTRDAKDEIVWVAVWVNAMDELAGGKPGAGEQDAYFKFDWANAKEIVGDSAVATKPEAPVSNEIKINVNGKEVKGDVAPFIENERTMVPVRLISEALGVEVEWNQDEQMVTVKGGDINATLVVGKAEIVKNGVAMAIDQAAINKDGRIFVPIRAIAEMLQAKVGWDNEARTAVITK